MAAPHFIPSHSNNIDIVYVFRFSGISSFCFSFIQMNNITRTRNRGKEGVFGGEFGRTFSCIFIKNAIEKHPGNFMVLGVPVPLLFGYFRNIRCVRYCNISSVPEYVLSKYKPNDSISSKPNVSGGHLFYHPSFVQLVFRNLRIVCQFCSCHPHRHRSFLAVDDKSLLIANLQHPQNGVTIAHQPLHR